MTHRTVLVPEEYILKLSERIRPVLQKSDNYPDRLRVALEVAGTGLEDGILRTILEIADQVDPVWKYVTLGTHKSAEELIQAVEDSGCMVSEVVRNLVISANSIVSSTSTTIKLLKVTVAQLGFPKYAFTQDLEQRITEAGLAPCPLEVALQLRLQYHDQPKKDEGLVVWVDPLINAEGNRVVLGVINDCKERWVPHSSKAGTWVPVGGDTYSPWILSYLAHGGITWNSDTQLVLARTAQTPVLVQQ
jgi:hypothetical protein